MTLFWGVVAYVLYLYIIVIVARIIIDWIRQFAHSWRPAGFAAVGIEVVYVATDPPIRLLRRVVPPLHLGSVSLDLSVLILLLATLGLKWAALTLAQ